MRRMRFSDNVEKGKKGRRKKGRIDHAGVRSEHQSRHCRDGDLLQMSCV